MFRNMLWIGLVLSVLGLATAPFAGAEEWNNMANSATASVDAEQTGQTVRDTLPETASNMPTLVLVGIVGISLGTLLLMFRRANAPARSK